MVLRIRAIIAIALPLLLLAGKTDATGIQRAFVASTGNDAASCQLATPCRSIGTAIAKTLSGGEVIVLDSAGYGPVTVITSVSIIAPPGVYGGISVLSGNGVTINAPGATVVLRGLSINGEGGTHGILLQQAARVRVESCVISHMSGVGIYHTAPSAEMIVLDTIARDNADGFGLVAHDGSILLDHVRSEHNQNGGFYIAPTPGSSVVSATIVDSVFSYNGINGIWVDTVGGALTRAQVERSVMSNNGNDGFTATSGTGFAHVTLGRNAIGSNGHIAIELVAPTGYIRAMMSENIIQHNDGGIYATGAGTLAYANANTVDGLACDPSTSTVYSFGNNAMIGGYLLGCITKIGAF